MFNPPPRRANHSMQRMGASRSAQSRFQRPWRLAPTADAGRCCDTWLCARMRTHE